MISAGKIFAFEQARSAGVRIYNVCIMKPHLTSLAQLNKLVNII